MKKLIALILTLALVLGLATSAFAYSDKNLEAPKAKDVVIDGDLSEWDTSKALKINAENQIVDQIEHWDGEADCSMEVYAMWDEENLYIAMKILDADPFVYRDGFPLDELDAIIIFLSTDPEADPDRTEYTATDWRITHSIEKYSKKNSVVYNPYTYVDREMIADNKGFDTQGEYGDLLAEDIFSDYEVGVNEIEGGFVMEIRLPLAELANNEIPQLVPETGKSIGFDASVMDVDLPCPGIHSLRMQYTANLDGDRTPEKHPVDTNPSLWATLTFVD
jgi:hypothetical protein